MDFHVITPSGSYLIMTIVNGRVVQVQPTPTDSRPRAIAAPVDKFPGSR